MTIKELKAKLSAVGVTVTFDWDLDEYRVCVKGASEATAYYTNDIEDALKTGLSMADDASKAPRAVNTFDDCGDQNTEGF